MICPCVARDQDRVRCRMFAPLSGTWEDLATGSANAALAALLLDLANDDGVTISSRQGVEMVAKAALKEAWRKNGEVFASVAGECVPVLSGKVEL